MLLTGLAALGCNDDGDAVDAASAAGNGSGGGTGGHGGAPASGSGGGGAGGGCPGGGVVGNSPYPGSCLLSGMSLDWGTHDRRADGSDNFAITWADDDHQYTVWGDGWGFEDQPTKMSFGVSRIEGSPTDYAGFDVFGAPDGQPLAGKSYGIVSIGGVLYAWWGPGSNTTSYGQTSLIMSDDKGDSWTKSPWDLTDSSETLIMPTILNFGRDYAGARDGYVYHYFIRKQGDPMALEVHQPGMIDLARVPAEQLMDVDGYEYFGGVGSDGAPTWTSTPADRQPVFEDPAGVGWNVSVSFNEGLGRYLLATEHSASFVGNAGFFDAPNPWGPWTTVAYFEAAVGGAFGEGEIETSTFFFNFANKWASADGEQFVLLFTGINSNDSWNMVAGSFDIHLEGS